MKKAEKRYKIVFEREGCIGSACCAAVDPENWKILDDGKSMLKNSREVMKDVRYEKEISEEEYKKFLDAAQGCPVNVIHIVDLKTGKRVI